MNLNHNKAADSSDNKKTQSAYLEITVQLINGAKLRFSEPEPANAKAFLKNLKPNKIFSEKILPIMGPNSLTGIATDRISWIIFHTSEKLSWPFPANVSRAEVITARGYKNAMTTQLPTLKKNMHSNERGQSLEAYWHARMIDGADFYFRIHGENLSRMEKLQVPKSLAELPEFHGIGANGGAAVLNIANVLAWTVFPGPEEYAKNTWQLEKI